MKNTHGSVNFQALHNSTVKATARYLQPQPLLLSSFLALESFGRPSHLAEKCGKWENLGSFSWATRISYQ